MAPEAQFRGEGEEGQRRRGRTKKKEECWSKRIKYHGMLTQSNVKPKTMFAENIYGCHLIIAD